MTGLDWRAWGAVMELDSGREAPRVGWRRPIEVEPLSVYDRRGDGHTLSRHCGNSPEMEAERLGRHPQLPATGSFPDAATAQRAVEACVAANRGTVELWRRGARSRLAISHDMGEVVGDVLLRGRLLAGDTSPLPATAVRVVLRRNRTYRAGFAVLTAYPVIRPGATYPRHP
jgi:Bacterial CdiA-CT RNAse A domain